MGSSPTTAGMTGGYSRVFHIFCTSGQATREDWKKEKQIPHTRLHWFGFSLNIFIATISQKKFTVQVLLYSSLNCKADSRPTNVLHSQWHLLLHFHLDKINIHHTQNLICLYFCWGEKCARESKMWTTFLTLLKHKPEAQRVKVFSCMYCW